MNVDIRRAELRDLEQAVQLWSNLHREHEALDARYRLADDATLRWSNDFREFIRSERHHYLVAELETGRLVGLLVAQVGYAAPIYAPELFVHINELFVAESAREQDVGQKLVREVRQWAAVIGAQNVRAGVLAVNQLGRSFWKRLGAVDYSVEVIIEPY